MGHGAAQQEQALAETARRARQVEHHVPQRAPPGIVGRGLRHGHLRGGKLAAAGPQFAIHRYRRPAGGEPRWRPDGQALPADQLLTGPEGAYTVVFFAHPIVRDHHARVVMLRQRGRGRRRVRGGGRLQGSSRLRVYCSYTSSDDQQHPGPAPEGQQCEVRCREHGRVRIQGLWIVGDAKNIAVSARWMLARGRRGLYVGFAVRRVNGREAATDGSKLPRAADFPCIPPKQKPLTLANQGLSLWCRRHESNTRPSHYE